MAPIDPELYNSNLVPALVAGAGLSSLVIILSVVGRLIYRSRAALPPSQGTRDREHSRDKHVIIFSVLSAISLSVSLFWRRETLNLSYQTWASERGEHVPEDPLRDFLTLKDVQLGRWFGDLDVPGLLFESAMEKSRQYWWTQQYVLGLTAFSIFLSISGNSTSLGNTSGVLLTTPYQDDAAMSPSCGYSYS